MPPPTLLIKGKLKVVTDRSGNVISQSQEDLDRHVPISYIMEWFDTRMNRVGAENRILILESSTGSGKSTAFPAYLYFYFFEKFGRRSTAITQPKILTTENIPRDQICPQYTRKHLDSIGKPNWEEIVLGKNIGYKTSIFKYAPSRGIIFMTIGTLSQQLNNMSDAEFMDMYSFIIIDEAHERDINIDLTLLKMKKFIQRNKGNNKCPFLVIASATIDVYKFCDYLLDDIDDERKRYKNIIKVEGNTHPIKEIFLPVDANNFYREAANLVDKINNTPVNIDDEFRDILIFSPGERESIMIAGYIENINKRNPQKPMFVITVSGNDVKNNTQNKINMFVDINTLKKNGVQVTRRVVIGTNVMETGLTIDTLGYVIESGWYKSAEFNPHINIGSLITKPISQASYKQRRGRVGRKAPGVCYALYTKDTFEKMAVNNLPEIQKNNIDSFVLEVIAANSGNLLKSVYDFNNLDIEDQSLIDLYGLEIMDIPSVQSLHMSLYKLITLGMIDHKTRITTCGFAAIKMPPVFPVELKKTILTAFAYNMPIIDVIHLVLCIRYTLKITDPAKHNVLLKKIHGDDINRRRVLISDDYIWDLLIFYGLDINDLRKDCDKYGIDSKLFGLMMEDKESIITSLLAMGMNPYRNYNKSIRTIKSESKLMKNISLLKQCIYEGNKMYMCKWNGTQYMTKFGMPVRVINSFMPELKNVILGIDTMPKYIISVGPIMDPNSKTGIYEIKVRRLSVLDGYISPDFNYDLV
jgi:HrpA-like RNA helicase